jgi:hypothetical protein
MINNFTGRDALMEQLRRLLLPASLAFKQRVVVLHGTGGVGKTQLALKYVDFFKSEYTAIFWISGRTEHSLKQGIANIARRIPLRQVLDATGNVASSVEAIDRAIRAVFDWLHLPRNFQWLMVLDDINGQNLGTVQNNVRSIRNVDAPEASYDIRPYFSPLDQGSIIIISRLSDVAQLGIGIEVPNMSLGGSIDILQQMSGDKSNNTGA